MAEKGEVVNMSNADRVRGQAAYLLNLARFFGVLAFLMGGANAIAGVSYPWGCALLETLTVAGLVVPFEATRVTWRRMQQPDSHLEPFEFWFIVGMSWMCGLFVAAVAGAAAAGIFYT